MTACKFLKHWEFQEKGENVHLFCPILQDGINSFKLYRGIYKELKELEKILSSKYSTAVMYTKINLDNVIKIITKLGYTPYFVNLEYDSIWFKKALRGSYVWWRWWWGRRWDRPRR